MVTKDNLKKSLNVSIKETTNALNKQARQNLIKNPDLSINLGDQ